VRPVGAKVTVMNIKQMLNSI